MLSKVEKDSYIASEQLVAFIMNWLQTHILEEDAKIGVFIKEKKDGDRSRRCLVGGQLGRMARGMRRRNVPSDNEGIGKV